VSTANGTGGRTVRKRVASLRPSPENGRLYRAPEDDPDLDGLADSIRKNGLRELPVITADNYIVSGHRRHAALQRLGQTWVTCRVLNVRRDAMSQDEYIALLRDHNRQRNKTAAEQMREELVDIDAESAHANLLRLRDHSVNAARHNGVCPLVIEGTKRRYNISDDKAEHMKHVLQIVEERRDYWPLSVRGVHYPLLNFHFVRGYYWPHRDEPDYGTKRTLYYKNDQGSYDATSDLITRLRLNGTIPWEAFDDPTRPATDLRPFQNVREFIREEVENLFDGYWRDLLQSQPHYVEVLVEKNTVYHMVTQMTRRYVIETRRARGFNAIDSLHDIHQAYLGSGKDRLVLIVLSDYDPEGQMILHDAGRRLRDDFGVNNLQIFPAGVTREQVERYQLQPMNFAKETSSNHDWFVERNGGDGTVSELEALDPADMLADLERVIQSVLDLDLFNREAAAEQEEAATLEAARRVAGEALQGLCE
jgi:hypothetical protein